MTMTMTPRPARPIRPADRHPGGDRMPLRHARPVLVVHTALRRELRLAGPLVRRVEVGDTARAGIVAAHLDLLLRGLHHHHQLEDDLVWPLLRARVGADLVSLVEVMEAQHDRIDRLVGDSCRVRASWSVTASAGTRLHLGDRLDELHDALVEHLDLEEREVLPLAERHVTEPEWRTIGARAEAGSAGRERALAFGMLQHEGDPEVLASMLADAPWPARVLVPRLARRAYRRHALAVHGTPTP